MLNNTLTVLTLREPLNDLACPLLHLACNLTELVKSLQETFDNITAHLLHNCRRRVNTEALFEPFNERVTYVLLNPLADVLNSIPDTLKQTRYPVKTALLRAVIIGQIFLEVTVNVLPDTLYETCDTAYSGSPSRTQCLEETLCHACKVNAFDTSLEILPQVFAHLVPVIACNPLLGFIECALQEIANALSYKAPIQATKQANHKIKGYSDTTNQKSTQICEVNFLHCTIQQFRYMVAQVLEVRCL